MLDRARVVELLRTLRVQVRETFGVRSFGLITREHNVYDVDKERNYAGYALFVLPGTIAAQEKTQAPPVKVIQHASVKTVSPASGGEEMYMSYRAVCHGTDGKGGGPAASALKPAPTDLTLLSKNNGGKYPALKVTSTIRGEAAIPVHGTKEMSVWGPLFGSMRSGN